MPVFVCCFLFLLTEVTIFTVGLEEELELVRKEKDQLNQERSRVLESERKIGEELRENNRELAGKTRLVGWIKNSLVLGPINNF